MSYDVSFITIECFGICDECGKEAYLMQLHNVHIFDGQYWCRDGC